MAVHLQIWTTAFYGMSQAKGLGPHSRRAYEALGRFWQVAEWILSGTYRRNLARERARDVGELAAELRRLGTQDARQLAKVIVADRDLHKDIWDRIRARSR